MKGERTQPTTTAAAVAKEEEGGVWQRVHSKKREESLPNSTASTPAEYPFLYSLQRRIDKCFYIQQNGWWHGHPKADYVYTIPTMRTQERPICVSTVHIIWDPLFLFLFLRVAHQSLLKTSSLWLLVVLLVVSKDFNDADEWTTSDDDDASRVPFYTRRIKDYTTRANECCVYATLEMTHVYLLLYRKEEEKDEEKLSDVHQQKSQKGKFLLTQNDLFKFK